MVAERAGVSIASVSRVLNGLATSDDVRDNVLRAAAELDYVPDAVARSLKVGRTDQIALAVADVGNPVYVTMIHAITEVLGAAGLRLVISSGGADPDDQLGLLGNLGPRLLRRPDPQPTACDPGAARRPRRYRQPVVVIGSLPPDLDSTTCVPTRPRVSDSPWIISLPAGRRRIAFVNGPIDTVPGAARLRGFVEHGTRLELPISADLQVECADFTYAAAVPAVETLLAQATPDAIMCANDLLAVAAINVVQRHGKSVPDDIAVVGMDDTDIAELVNPTLTSVDLGAARPRRHGGRATPRPPRKRRHAGSADHDRPVTHRPRVLVTSASARVERGRE